VPKIVEGTAVYGVSEDTDLF